MSGPGVILFTVGNGNICKAGLPPAPDLDNYDGRALVVGQLQNPSHVFFSPDSKLYVVQGSQLFTGPMPSNSSENWIGDIAKCVGRTDWEQFKFLLFHPDGSLYAVSHRGELYKGPPPTNENVSWLYTQATKIGLCAWTMFSALFFDPQGILYAATDYDLVRKSPPPNTDENWVGESQTIGCGSEWSNLSHFMSFSPDGNLWCVSKEDGNIYTASPPTEAHEKWLSRAKNLGTGYLYKFMAFTRDSTIKSIVSINFQPDEGKVLSTVSEVVAQQVYHNKKGTSPLNAVFTFSKTCVAGSSFSDELGFTLSAEDGVTFKTGVPCIEGGGKISISESSTHNWSLTQANRTETNFSRSQTFEVNPGKAVLQMAIVQKAKLDVPYIAKVRTLFNNEATIRGTWQGVVYFNLNIMQEDI